MDEPKLIPTRWEHGHPIYGMNNQCRCIKCGERIRAGESVVCRECVELTKELQRGKF